MEFKVKNKLVEIVFDYRTMFKVDKKLATINAQTGESNNDGVGNLFNKILNQDDSGLVDLIILCAGKTLVKGVSEDDAISAIETWLSEHEAEDTGVLFEAIQQEMVDSGFFKQKILKYIGNMEQSLEYMQAQTATNEERELQVKAVEGLIGKMKSVLS